MNKYIIITFIGIFSIIILNCYIYWNTNMSIEFFSNPIKTESIILVGDSILKNNSYVLEEKSVEKSNPPSPVIISAFSGRCLAISNILLLMLVKKKKLRRSLVN